MLDNVIVRWVLIALVALAVIGLVTKARGDDSDTGRDPEGDSLPALVIQVS